MRRLVLDFDIKYMVTYRSCCTIIFLPRSLSAPVFILAPRPIVSHLTAAATSKMVETGCDMRKQAARSVGILCLY